MLFTYRELEEAYQSCVVGKKEPSALRLSPSIYGEFLERYQRCNQFNGARVSWDGAVSDDEFVYEFPDGSRRMFGRATGIGKALVK